MSDIVLPHINTGKRWAGLGLRARVVLIWSALVAVAFLVGSGFLIRNAWEERRITMGRSAAASLATANAFEREIAASGYLLMGLSRSPALLAGDLEGFYEQLIATPKPEDSWLVLWDLDRQLLNTLRPLGAELPQIADFSSSPESRRRIRERGLSVSDRVHGVVTGRDTVSISLRLDGPDGEMNGRLTTQLPVARLDAIAREAVLPAGWKTYILDRNLMPVAASDVERRSPPQLPSEVAERIRAQAGSGAFFGHDEAADVLVAYYRLPAPEFTAVTTVPLALVNAPVAETAFRITLAGVGLTVLGVLASILVARQVGSIEILKSRTEIRLRSAEVEIEQGRRLLQRVVETSPDVIYVFDVQGHRNVFLGGRVDEVLGYSPEDVRAMGGEVLTELVHPDDFPSVREHLARLLDLQDGEVATVEYRMQDAAGRYRWLRSKETVFSRASDGRVACVLGIASETSDMKAAEAKIIDANERLRSILSSISDCYFTLDHTYRITDINEAAEQWIGIPREQVVGRCLWDLCDPEAECSCVIREGMEQRHGLRRKVASGLRPGRWLDLHAYPSTKGLSAFFSDVTERCAAEAAVNELSERLLRLQDDERRRIAEELHDSTAQHLVAVGLSLMRLQKYITADEGHRLLDEAAISGEEAVKELRAFTYLLHPPGLESGGLSRTVREFASGFARRTGLEASVSISEEADGLPFELQRSLLRVIQEALTNTYRHAAASRVTIDLRCGSGAIKLCILDDGRGMARGMQKAASDQTGVDGASLGVGVAGMRARLLQFGGHLRLLSGHRGTMVIATLPLGRRPVGPHHQELPARVSGFSPVPPAPEMRKLFVG